MELFDYERAHLGYLRQHLAECTVLLKSDGSFPLEAPCSIAAYGGGVRRTVKGGTGSGEVNSRFFVSVEQGLKNAGFTLVDSRWQDGYEEACKAAEKMFVRRVKAEARKKHTLALIDGMGRIMPEPEYALPLCFDADAAIYVLSRISGEGSDRSAVPGDILLTETEKRDILLLNSRYQKFMLVLNVGGPVDLSPVMQVGNILLLSQLGVQTGDALADILLGKQNPSGKLTTTWAAHDAYAPTDFGDANNTRYREGVFVGYRYFDSVGKKPLFPFGHGLSYTEFSLSDTDITLDGDKVCACTTVENKGALPGKEVVQLYVSSPAGTLPKPFKELAGFGKTELLQPGEKQRICISFRLSQMASYSEKSGAYILEKGDYLLRLGCKGEDAAPAAVLRLKADITVRCAPPCCGSIDFEDWQPEQLPAQADLPKNIKILEMPAEAVIAAPAPKAPACPIEPEAEALTDRQLMLAGIGAFNPRAGALSVIGNASSLVAGAAGETTAFLTGQGLPQIVVADGPAGIRVSASLYRDARGEHPVGKNGLPESMARFMPAPLRAVTRLMGSGGKAPKGVEVQHRYATALPIGTAIAQSWNTGFARGCGELVGDEMQRFGVHLWLAPALNIHRSIRCGRNFEYFSEDPVISGLMAAALTAGVQSREGCGVTIKHYAANNQETNRYGSNSMVSERAMREIYLKGFAICVREAAPMAVMTSYNLLCGTHTAEHRGLCEDILRGEFGFDGIIMSDWVVGGGIMNSRDDIHPAVRPGLAAAAGGDLFMPGCKKDLMDMEKALAQGLLTREQLLVNASRVFRTAKKLTGR